MKHFFRNGLALLGGALALAACKDNPIVGPINSTKVTVGPLSSAALQTAVTGVLQQTRANAGLTYFYVGGVLGRDVYRFDPSEQRYIYEAYTSAISRTSFFGASQFNGEYTTIRAANTLLANLQQTPDSVASAQQKQAISGLVHTLQALEYYRVEEYHDTLGTPIQMADSSKLGDVLCAPAALRYISTLLDQANTELKAGSAGSATARFTVANGVPLSFPSGFKTQGDFSFIENFRRVVNRGLKGKVEVYLGIGRANVPGTATNFTNAIAALDEAIGTLPATPTQAQLNFGPYYQYSTAPGEIANPLADANVFVNPSFVDSAQAGDQRVANKVLTLATPVSYNARGFIYTTPYSPTVSSTANPANFVRPIAIIRVGELVLLRAQAKIGLGQYAAAAADLNLVRTVEGGLAPIAAATTQAQAISQLLYEKRYSLFLEGPQRLTDLRAYGRINATYLPKEGKNSAGVSGDRFQKALPIPQGELDQRGGSVTLSCPTS